MAKTNKSPFIKNCLNGMLIYGIGDSVAALIQSEFMLMRMLGMMLIGGSFYAIEVPAYFNWIERFINSNHSLISSLKRTLLAMAYFNPLWIARHLFFIKLFSGQWQSLNWNLLYISSFSFLANIPISLIGNYLIQNKIPLAWRFIASSIFSGLLAVYYACSEVFFAGN